jgi:hypothetical protein
VASPRPDVRSASGVAAGAVKRHSLDVPGGNENSSANVQPTHTPTHTPGRSVTNPVITASANSAPTANGQSTPVSPDIVPSIFSGGGPGPHIPPPVDDDSPVNETSGPLADAVEENVEMPSVQGSLRRTAKGSGGRRTAGGSSLGGGLKRHASRDKGGVMEHHGLPAEGVTLEDRPMDY